MMEDYVSRDARVMLGDLLEELARREPDRVLLIEGEMQLTVQTLHSQAHALARGLLSRAPAGSTLAFMLPNWHEAAVIYMGATLAGMVALPILPSLRERDLAFALADSKSRFIFIPESYRGHDYAAMVAGVVGELKDPPHVVVVRGEPRGHIPFESLIASRAEPALPAIDPDAVRMMMYTSGTTGRPKGVLHTHRTLGALIQQLGQHWLVEEGDSFLVASPISHIGGSIYAFEAPLILGSTAILMERWDADEAIRLAERHGWTHMAGATPFLEHLLSAARRAGTRLPNLKLFICGGAAVPPSLIREASAYFEQAIVTRVYGSTETPVATVGSIGDGEHDYAADTDGRPGIAQIKIAPHPAAPAGEGEVRVRGPQMLIGYLHPEDEAGAFDEEGYFCTGDLGRWIGGDHLVITGRAKDIIIRNGENISAKEVEDLLAGHPDILDVAVVGVPDAKTGERACAVIVPKLGAEPSLEDLRDFLDAQRLARFKYPEKVVLVDTLPRNDAGKVLKEQLRTALKAELVI